MSEERTLILVKPDGVQRGLVHQVIKRFEMRGYALVAIKMVNATTAQVEAHYDHLRDCDFFPDLRAYMTSGPVCAMVWQGTNVVQAGRQILGATYPHLWTPGTLRGDFCQVVERCVAHASDSVDNGARELGLWFPEGVLSYTLSVTAWTNVQ